MGAVEIKEVDGPSVSGAFAKVVCLEDGSGGGARDPRPVKIHRSSPGLALPNFLQELVAEAARKRPNVEQAEAPPAKRVPDLNPPSLMATMPAAGFPMQPRPFLPVEPVAMLAPYPAPYFRQPPPANMPFPLPSRLQDGFSAMDIPGMLPDGFPPIVPPAGPPPLDLLGPMQLHASHDLPNPMHHGGQAGEVRGFGQRGRPAPKKKRKTIDQLMRDFDEIINYNDSELLRKYQYVTHRVSWYPRELPDNAS